MTSLADFASAQLDDTADPWAEVGKAFARASMNDWRYSDFHGWAEWNGQHWSMVTDRDAHRVILDNAVESILGVIQDCYGHDPVKGIAMAKQWKASGPVMVSFLAGCRNECRGFVPEPDITRFFPAANGVVDLTTGQLHDPRYGVWLPRRRQG